MTLTAEPFACSRGGWLRTRNRQSPFDYKSHIRFRPLKSAKSKNSRNPKPLERHRANAVLAWKELLAESMTTLTSIIVIAVALVLPLILTTINTEIQSALNTYTDNPQLTAYLAPAAEIDQVSEYLLTREDISFIELMPKSQGLAELATAPGLSNIIDALETNPLPDALVITPLLTQLDELESLAGQLQSDPNIELVQFDSQWLSKLLAISAAIVRTGSLLGVLSIIAFVLVIANTVKFLIGNSKEQIRIQQLLGASDSFIVRPLIYKGFYFGICGSLLALLLQAGFFLLFNASLTAYFQLSDSANTAVIQFGMSFSLGILVLLVSGIFSLSIAFIFGHLQIRQLGP